MKKLSLFVATKELLASPALASYANLHNLTLTTDDRCVIGLTLRWLQQTNSPPRLYLKYDSDHIDVCAVSVIASKLNRRRITVLVCLHPREIGTTELVFTDGTKASEILSVYYPSSSDRRQRTHPFMSIRNNPVPSSKLRATLPDETVSTTSRTSPTRI